MTKQANNSRPAAFVFICGAVGSGNTFLFNCLTNDNNVFGVDEDAFGSTLERLIESERSMGKCPHSIDAFVRFLQDLHGERHTLILKTPSNLRRTSILRKHIPNSRFVLMLREPHAAIVSGMARDADPSVEKVARLWLNDCQHFSDPSDDALIMTFEELIRDPIASLRHVARIHPISDDVLTYAQRVNRPERAEPEWWKSKVDASTTAEIEAWVRKLDLTGTYNIIANIAEAARRRGAQPEVQTLHPVASVGLMNPIARLRKLFFQGYYRFVR